MIPNLILSNVRPATPSGFGRLHQNQEEKLQTTERPSEKFTTEMRPFHHVTYAKRADTEAKPEEAIQKALSRHPGSSMRFTGSGYGRIFTLPEFSGIFD